jgi:vitamin K-dependent gamma-carboxylase
VHGPVHRPWRARALLLHDRLLAARVDAASLAAFRILFGLLMAAATIRFMALGWVDEFYVLPTFHFTWAPFPWVAPLPAPLMHLHFAALAVLALAVALGFHYRVSMLLFFVGFTYVELIDKTTYLNHYYLVSLLSGLLVVLPAHQIWSVDRWRQPGPATRTVPAWTVNLLRFQIGVVYVFAGLAKLNADWLLDAQPLRIWLAARSDVPIVGPLFTEMWVAYGFSWFGAAYDLTIVFFLLWRRTRPVAYVTVIVFHAMTAVLFPIGMFPWIMIGATLIFFPPDWPRRWGGGRRTHPLTDFRAYSLHKFTVPMLAVYALIQIALPLRAYWPGVDSDWTCRGFNFAWRVMLIEKAGHAELTAADRSTGRQWPVRLRDYVTERQEKMMAQDPFMIRALARHVAADLRARSVADVEVRADAFAALNGRPVQRLIDPDVDLAAPSLAEWIVLLQRDSAPPVDARSR